MPLFCRRCGTSLSEGSAFCSACGIPVDSERSISPAKPLSATQYSIVGESINPTEYVDTDSNRLSEVGRSLGIGGFVVVAVVLLGIAFAIWRNASSDSASTSAAPTNESQPESIIPLPQRSFTIMVESFIPRYNNADTEIRKTNVRFERKDAIVQYFSASGSLRFQEWVGEVQDLKTERDGEASFSVKLKGSETIIGTWNNSLSDSFSHTMISRGDALYPSLMEIKNGDEVTVSGTFIIEGNGQDYVREESLTEPGSMTSPEFLVRFSQVGKVN
jgi:hypothetical protein